MEQMAKHPAKVEKPVDKGRILQEKEIINFFAALNLSTAADREKFLRLEEFSKDANSAKDLPNETLRVRFGNSTGSTPALE
jgi:hypothetical protein